jgi:hypothetical protein
MYALETTFCLFSLHGKSAVPFHYRQMDAKIDQLAKAIGEACQDSEAYVGIWLLPGNAADCF